MANFHKLVETFTRYHSGYNYGILTSISWDMGSHLRRSLELNPQVRDMWSAQSGDPYIDS